MNFVLPHLEGTVLVFMLTFARVGAMIMLLPVLGDVGVPSRVRLAFALAVSFALAPVVAKYYPAQAPGTIALAVLIARETTAGIVIGAMARLIMSALEVAGTVIATQTGLAFAQTFDPTQNQQSAIIGTFLSLLGVVLIFETGLHHLIIGAISGSYTLLPPAGAFPVGDMAKLVVDIVAGAFALGLQLAAPFVVFGLLIYVALGIVSRLMPQLQVFFVAMPLNILVGFILLMLFVGTIATMFTDYFGTQMSQFQG